MEENKSKMYIHVGLHKTGTTFLQKHVFPKIKGIDYFDSFNSRRNFCFKIPKKGKILISDESLTNYNFEDSVEVSSFEIMRRLKLIYPSAKIIVTFRDKEDWEKSLFNQYLRSGGNLNFEKWCERIFSKKDIDFDKFESYVKILFDEVLVLWYNDLKNDPYAFVGNICDFMNVEIPEFSVVQEYKSFTKRQLSFIKFINKINFSDKWKNETRRLIKFFFHRLNKG